MKETIYIENLPKEFENFTILQLSDLHEKVFGKSQSYLTKIINKLDYDVIAMTGDMQTVGSYNDEPLIQLLDGIKNKDYVFYVAGNHGPEYSKKIEEKGCILLDKPYKLTKGQSSMYFYTFYEDDGFGDDIKYVDKPSTNIAINHYPFHENFYATANKTIGDYDLVIAGHYHGGQYRIPFYGALFVPDINGNGFLPNQEDVSGLNTYGKYQQYISKGLGASGSRFMKFRLFNTPEINLITLKNKSS